MKDRNVLILKAAQLVFARYGVSKTTMNDIAREAGVARQTLYNAYLSKEAVLRATVRHEAETKIDTIEAKWRDQKHLSDKLETFFQLGPLYWYDIVQSSPEVADLIDGINAIAQEELIDIAKLWNELFEAVVRRHMKRDTSADIDPLQIADFIYSTSMNAKHNAPDRSVLEARLKILKLSVLALFEDAETV